MSVPLHIVRISRHGQRGRHSGPLELHPRLHGNGRPPQSMCRAGPSTTAATVLQNEPGRPGPEWRLDLQSCRCASQGSVESNRHLPPAPLRPTHAPVRQHRRSCVGPSQVAHRRGQRSDCRNSPPSQLQPADQMVGRHAALPLRRRHGSRGPGQAAEVQLTLSIGSPSSHAIACGGPSTPPTGSTWIICSRAIARLQSHP